MRSWAIAFSLFIVLVLLSLFTWYLYKFDYSDALRNAQSKKSNAIVVLDSGVSDKGISLALSSIQRVIDGNSFVLGIGISNNINNARILDTTKCSASATIISEGKPVLHDMQRIFGQKGDAFTSALPPRINELPAPMVMVYTDVFDLVKNMPAGNHSIKITMNLALQEGVVAKVESNALEFVLLSRRQP